MRDATIAEVLERMRLHSVSSIVDVTPATVRDWLTVIEAESVRTSNFRSDAFEKLMRDLSGENQGAARQGLRELFFEVLHENAVLKLRAR